MILRNRAVCTKVLNNLKGIGLNDLMAPFQPEIFYDSMMINLHMLQRQVVSKQLGRPEHIRFMHFVMVFQA